MYTSKTLFSLVTDMSRNELFLPHIQRAFVWEEDQIIKLFDSLMRNYPIQTLLFWKTNEEIRARKFQNPIDKDCDLHDLYDRDKSRSGVEKTFVLDGQQRLQSLFCLFSGGILNEKTGEIKEAFFNTLEKGVTETDGLIHHVVFQSSVPGDEWYRLKDLMAIDNQKKPRDIAKQVISKIEANSHEQLPRETCEVIEDNLDQVVNILRSDGHFWIKELDGIANDFTYKKILEIFIRVNNGGTKLDSMDLMFASMKEGWDEIEEKIEGTVSILNSHGLSFDSLFVVKCIMCALNKGVDISPEKFDGSKGQEILEEITGEWDRLEKAFVALADLTKSKFKINSSGLVRTYNSLIPIYVFLASHPTPQEIEIPKIYSYYYKAQMLRWFDRQTDIIVSRICEYCRTSSGQFPLDKIINYFGQERDKPTTLSNDELNSARNRVYILNILYDRSNSTSPFDVRLKENMPQADHIYPKSILKKWGASAEKINSIGNFRFIGAIDNNRKRAELPSSYFERCKHSGIDIAKHLLVEKYYKDPSEMKGNLDSFIEFEESRFKLIKDYITSALELNSMKS